MSKKIIVKTLSGESVKVNHKVVYRDHNGNWIACTELSTKEAEAFALFKSAVIDPTGTPNGELTYTI